MHVKRAKQAITWTTVLALGAIQMVNLGHQTRPDFKEGSNVATDALRIQRMQDGTRAMLVDDSCAETMITCDGGGGAPPPSNTYYGSWYNGGAYTDDYTSHQYMNSAYAADANAFNEYAWNWEDQQQLAAWPGAVVAGLRYAYQAGRALAGTARFRGYVAAAGRFARDVAVGVVGALLAGGWGPVFYNADYIGPVEELDFMFDYGSVS